MPQPLAHDDQQQPIPWDKLGEAIQQGKAHYYSDDKVTLFDPSSKDWKQVTGADVGQHLKAGWRIPAPDAVHAKESEDAAAEQKHKFGTLGQAAVAGVEGYMRGATGGLSDVVATQLGGPDYAAAAKTRADVHKPWAAWNELYGLGSQVVGGTVLSGGAAAPEEAGLAARALGGAARAITAPGRLLGAAGEATAETLAKRAAIAGITGESLGGRAALGAIRGAGAGATEGAILGAGQEASEASLENRPLSAQKLWAAVGHGAIVGGVGGGLLGGLSAPVGEAGRRVVERMSEGSSMGDALSDVAGKSMFKNVAGNNQAIYNEATYFGRDPDRLVRIGKKLLDEGVSTKDTVAAKQIVSLTEGAASRMNELAKLRDGMADVGVEVTGAQQALDSVRKQVEEIRKIPLGTHQGIADAIEKEVAPLQAAVDAGTPVNFRQLWDIRKEMYKGINYARDTQQPYYREMREMARNFDDALDSEMGKLGSPPPGPSPLDQWLKAKEDFHDMMTAKDAIDATLVRRGKNRAVSLTDNMMGMAAGMATGNPIVGAAAAAGNKLLRERGPGAMAKMLDAVAKFDIRMTRASKALVSGAQPAIRRELAVFPRRDVNAEFSQKRDMLLDLAGDEAKAHEVFGKALTGMEAHADLHTDLAKVFGLANAYLLGKLPKPLSRASFSMTPVLEKQRVPRSEKVKWLEAYEAIDDPVGSMVSDLEKGRVSRTKLEAVRAVYPDLYADWAERVEHMVAYQGKRMPYKRRVFLSLAFDFNGDRSLEPAFLADIQAANGATLAAASQAAGGSESVGPMPSKNFDTQSFSKH